MLKIRNIREDLRLKQNDIALILGIKRSTYSSYEIERDTIPIKHLNKLCNYFNVSLDYVLGLTKIKQYPNIKKSINRDLTKKRLKELRLENKLTQKEIAHILNISRSTWTGYEYGIYQIPTLLLYELAKRYHSSIDYLLGKIIINPYKK